MRFTVFSDNRRHDHVTAVRTSGPEDPARAQSSHFAFGRHMFG
jgi:hypothetical protein